MFVYILDFVERFLGITRQTGEAGPRQARRGSLQRGSWGVVLHLHLGALVRVRGGEVPEKREQRIDDLSLGL
eukprot:7208983-Pyramimonas_sp.AAC.1